MLFNRKYLAFYSKRIYEGAIARAVAMLCESRRTGNDATLFPNWHIVCTFRKIRTICFASTLYALINKHNAYA